MTFGEKLQALRKSKGMSQEQLATQLTVSRQTISKWELRESVPDTDNVLQLSRLFGCSIDYLLKDEIKMDTNTPTVATKESDKTHIRNTTAFSVALGICLAGLLISFAGWRMWQTILSVCIGIMVQIIGIVVFEIMNCNNDRLITQQLRRKFYCVTCWIITPYPVSWLTSFAFSFYPKPYFSWITLVVSAVLYILICSISTFLLKRIYRDENLLIK